MNSGTASLVLVTAFVLTAWLTYRFGRPGSWFYTLDHPNDRSLHARPTPRSGGIAIVLSCLIVGAVALYYIGQTDRVVLWIVGSAMLVALGAVIDDRTHLSPVVRLAIHFVAAGTLVYGSDLWHTGMLKIGSWIVPDVIIGTLTILFIVWMINLYNFMDGMDGFAGGMTVIGFGALAVVSGLGGAVDIAILAVVIAAAAGGFLVFNFPPARIFMGDTGSSTLGFLAAALSLLAAQRGVLPIWAALLIFSPFIVDATVTLARRMLKREKVWRAHKTHYYQRLVQLGWGHRRTVLIEYGIMATCAVAAVFAVGSSVARQWLILIGALTLYTAFFAYVHWLERRK